VAIELEADDVAVAEVSPPSAPRSIRWSAAPFVIFHLIPLLIIFTGISRTAIILFAVTYSLRVLFITGGYHRYFAHRAYKLGRVPQAILAFAGTTCVQRGPLWWAGNHRRHHRYADTDRDPHSPNRGFWWAHIGWVLSGEYSATPFDDIADFAAYPELRWINRRDAIGPWALGVTCFLIGGWSGLLVGFFLSTIVLWHATFMVNSVAHIVGRRRYETPDRSRNNWFVAIVTFGEGWHNNHHHFPACARQGFRWWEVDVTYYVLRAMAALHIVHDLKQPSPAALAHRRITSKQTAGAGADRR
jgi:stearoyl-CoA desaturase (delta-9 desaturase)